MGFPDRIERTVRIDRPLDRVWAAITTAEGLGPGSATARRSTCGSRHPRS